MATRRKKSGKWIQKAIKRPGALHKAAGVPKGKKIPASKLNALEKKAEKTGNTRLKRQVNLAKTLKKINRRRKRAK